MKNWKSAILATTILAAAQPALAQPWDPATSIGGVANSSNMQGPWNMIGRTGPNCNVGAPVTLGTQMVNGSNPSIGGGHDGANGDTFPLVTRNFGSNYVNSDTNIPANAVILHPSDRGECAILRLTVPAGAGGMYTVSATFQSAHSDPTPGPGDGVIAMVLRNGVLVGNTVNTAEGARRVNGQFALCPGHTLDFAASANANHYGDSTLLTGQVIRTGNVAGLACGPTIGDGGGVYTANEVTDLTGNPRVGDPIDMTGTPNRPRSSCCAPWSGVDILPALVPTFPTGATGPYTMSFTPSATLNAQMSAYLNYLHAVNPGVTTLTMSWQAANLGTGATAATSGTMIGGAQNVTWQWTNSGVTMNGGGFWTGAPFPIGSWIGFQTTVSVNGGQAGAALLGPDCRVNWSAWRAQAQQIRQGGNGQGSVVFETINARGQVQRTRPIDVRPGVAIETGQLLIRDRPN